MQIHIHKNGQTLGPFSLEQIKQGLQTNQYTLADLAHTQGLDGWKSLHDVLSYLRNQSNGGSRPPLPLTDPQQTANEVWQNAPRNRALPTTSGLHSNPAIRNFLNEEQDPAAVARVHERLMQICMADEQVLYIAVQKRPIITISPAAVALTNKRILMFRAQAFGLTLTFDDHYWMNVANVHISEAVLGSTFIARLTDNRQVFVDSLPKAQARCLYHFGQQMEEQMNRYRRDLMLEERRAGAGNFNVSVNNGFQQPMQGAPYQQQAPQFAPQAQQVNELPLASQQAPLPQNQAMAEDPIEVLTKLKTMLDRNLISQAEYDSKKAEIMARL